MSAGAYGSSRLAPPHGVSGACFSGVCRTANVMFAIAPWCCSPQNEDAGEDVSDFGPEKEEDGNTGGTEPSGEKDSADR